ncbi:MAG: class I SAM-dependent methyltransferase [bacterium]
MMPQRQNPAPPTRCPICAGGALPVNTLFLLELAECATYRCSACGLYFRHPLPAYEAVSRYYQNHFFRHPDAVEEAMARIQGRWMIDALRRHGVSTDSLHYIEYGAGRGWLVAFMQNQHRIKATGYEPDRQSVNWGREVLHVDLREGLFDEAIYSPDLAGSSPLFALVHVLEHLHDPLSVLRAAKEKNQSTYLFLEVPDAAYEGPVIESDTFPSSSMGQHFYSFNGKSLEILLERAGYTILACSRDGDPGYWNERRRMLHIWRTISEIYGEWQQKGFDLKSGMVKSLRVGWMCFAAGLLIVRRRIAGKKYTRLDLPIIRILARSNS